MLITAQTGTLARPAAGSVRPFFPRDLSEVVDLYTKVFPNGRQYPVGRLRARFEKILLQNPWYDPSIPSLVYEQEGRIIGFLGVVVRPMRLGNTPLRVAVSNHFMVDADARSTKAGLSLLSKFFAGPQDLAIAESGDASRKIWEALGGRTSLGYSLYWTRLLRPARYGLYQLERRSLPRYVPWLCRPFCDLADGIASRIKSSPLYQGSHPAEEEISVAELLKCISRSAGISGLRPSYDESTLDWLLGILAEKRALGSLRKAVFRGKRNEIVGWYIYYLNPNGVSTVLHMWSHGGHLDRILEHVSYHAWRQGSIALTGRLQPAYTREYAANQCFLHWRSWMLVHSRDAAILDAIERKDAFFTPLEGESWISIEGEVGDKP